MAHPEVQDRVHEEAQRAGATDGKEVTLEDRTQMPYTEGVLLEAIRLIASPIVPHVANQDASIAGKDVIRDPFVLNIEGAVSHRWITHDITMT